MANKKKSLERQIIEKFPDFDPNWPDRLKIKWFESFSLAVRLCPKKRADIRIRSLLLTKIQ